MLFDFGTVPAKQIVRMVAEKDFQALSPRMQAAAEEAIDAYAKTKNPQAIDLIIDRACYAEMSDAANASDNAFVRRLVQTKIDLLNVTIAVRVLRMSDQRGMNFMRDNTAKKWDAIAKPPKGKNDFPLL
jgi:V/A-type H+-transporting ATPase subunit C